MAAWVAPVVAAGASALSSMYGASKNAGAARGATVEAMRYSSPKRLMKEGNLFYNGLYRAGDDTATGAILARALEDYANRIGQTNTVLRERGAEEANRSLNTARTMIGSLQGLGLSGDVNSAGGGLPASLLLAAILNSQNIRNEANRDQTMYEDSREDTQLQNAFAIYNGITQMLRDRGLQRSALRAGLGPATPGNSYLQAANSLGMLGSMFADNPSWFSKDSTETDTRGPGPWADGYRY